MRALLIASFLLLSPIASRAETMVGQTAEWLTCSSDLVVKATPLEAQTIKGAGQTSFTQVRYRLDQVFKGPVTAGDVVTVFDHSLDADLPDMADASKKGRSVLLFAVVSKNRYRAIDGKYVVTLQHRPRSVFFLDQPVKDVYTPDSQRVTKMDELLDRVSKQVDRDEEFHRVYPRGHVEREFRESPFDSPAYADLHAGSMVYVFIPVYRTTERGASTKPAGD